MYQSFIARKNNSQLPWNNFRGCEVRGNFSSPYSKDTPDPFINGQIIYLSLTFIFLVYTEQVVYHSLNILISVLHSRYITTIGCATSYELLRCHAIVRYIIIFLHRKFLFFLRQSTTPAFGITAKFACWGNPTTFLGSLHEVSAAWLTLVWNGLPSTHHNILFAVRFFQSRRKTDLRPF